MNLSNLGQQAGQTLLSLIDGQPVAPGIRKLPAASSSGGHAEAHEIGRIETHAPDNGGDGRQQTMGGTP